FGDIEFTPDHVAAGTRVAVDLDALDIGPRPLIDHKGNIDALCSGIACGAGDRLCEGKTELRKLDRKNFVGLVERVADDIDVAEMIEWAFIDRKRDLKSVYRRIVFGLGRGHAGVGIALAAIVQRS